MARSAFADEAVTCRSNGNVFRYPELIVSVPVDRRESRNVVASVSRAPNFAQHIGMRIPGACCVWVFLCGSGSRFQFRVRDFRPRTQKVFCGQEFCGFKLTFRFCVCLEVFCRRTFLIPENARTYRPRPKCGGTPKFRWPPHLRTCVVPIGSIKMRARYSCGAAIQCQATTTTA